LFEVKTHEDKKRKIEDRGADRGLPRSSTDAPLRQHLPFFGAERNVLQSRVMVGFLPNQTFHLLKRETLKVICGTLVLKRKKVGSLILLSSDLALVQY